jgi:hypothetical protein
MESCHLGISEQWPLEKNMENGSPKVASQNRDAISRKTSLDSSSIKAGALPKSNSNDFWTARLPVLIPRFA